MSIKNLNLNLLVIDIAMAAVYIQVQQLVWSWLHVTSTPIIQGAVIAVDVMAWQRFVHANKEYNTKEKIDKLLFVCSLQNWWQFCVGLNVLCQIFDWSQKFKLN